MHICLHTFTLFTGIIFRFDQLLFVHLTHIQFYKINIFWIGCSHFSGINYLECLAIYFTRRIYSIWSQAHHRFTSSVIEHYSIPFASINNYRSCRRGSTWVAAVTEVLSAAHQCCVKVGARWASTALHWVICHVTCRIPTRQWAACSITCLHGIIKSLIIAAGMNWKAECNK